MRNGLACLFTLAVAAFSQSAPGVVNGLVTDLDGIAIGNAQVELRDSSGAKFETKSAGGSGFSLSVPPGTYAVSVASPGWQAFQPQKLTIAAGQPARIAAKLTDYASL